MGRYFDYRDWELDELCHSLRERISESKKPLPKKVMKHSVIVLYRTGEGSYMYPNWGWFSYGNVPDFKSKDEAEKYLLDVCNFTKIGENMYEDNHKNQTYTNADGNVVNCHYVIRESDYEAFEDGEYHIEYSDEEKQKLSEALYMIEKARVYMSVYDHYCDQWSFGNGRFSNELKTELENFEKEYTEEISDEEYN